MQRSWDDTLVSIVWAALAASTATPALAAETLWTSYMRAGPGPQFEVLQELPSRTALDVVGCQVGWCQVRFGSLTGYLPKMAVGDAIAPAMGAASNCFDTVLTGHRGGDYARICSR